MYLVPKSQFQFTCSRIRMLQCLKKRSPMVPFKVVHNRKTLVFELERSTSLDFLQRNIRAMFKIKVNESFDIYWIDDDNDRIILDSDEVLKIVLKAFQKQNNPCPMIKLNVMIQRGVKVLVEEPCPILHPPIIKQNSALNRNYKHDEIIVDC